MRSKDLVVHDIRLNYQSLCKQKCILLKYLFKKTLICLTYPMAVNKWFQKMLSKVVSKSQFCYSHVRSCEVVSEKSQHQLPIYIRSYQLSLVFLLRTKNFSYVDVL